MLSGLPLFGWAKPVPVSGYNLKTPRRDFAVIAAAGPISNLVLAVALAGLLGAIGGPESGGAGLLLAGAVRMNVLLAVFNLIPVPPLDGGNVLAGVLPVQLAYGLSRLAPYGFLILYALMFGGILSRFVFPIARAIADVLL
jgi:Zn-dependent protease